MKRSFGRRAFLGSLGGATAAATFLRPILAQSQTGAAPQRLLVIHRPCGSAMNAKDQPGAPSYWWPTSGASGATDWVAAPGGLIDSFKAVRDSMVILNGVHCPRVQGWNGDKHAAGMLAMISPSPKDPGNNRAWPVIPGRESEQNNANGQFFTATDRSIDQLLLNTIPTLKSPAAIPSISLTPDLISAQASNFCVRVVSYSKDNPNAAQPTALHPQADPAIAFQNIFGTGMTGMDAEALARARAQNKSVIDFINGGLNGLRPRLPKLAKDKVDAHLAAIRQLELQLDGPGSGRQCTPPALVAVDSTIPKGTAGDGDTNAGNDARYHQAALNQFQLIKTAFQCDLTRVASFTFGWGNSGIHFNSVIPKLLPNLKIDDVEGYHAVSHNHGTSPHQAQYAVDKYFCTMTANLLSDLANTPDAVSGGSLLDNTLVVFWNECSVGNSHDTHNMPVLLFGGKFLKLMGGHYFDFSSKAGGAGRYMSDLWTQVSQRWADADGVTGTSYQPIVKYGADQWNLGDMSELFG
jgi:Protein of unknown function (DUF1552)